MKLQIKNSAMLIFLSLLLMQGCNANLGIKEAGESIGKVADTVVEGVKQTPKAIGDAANNLGNKPEE